MLTATAAAMPTAGRVSSDPDAVAAAAPRPPVRLMAWARTPANAAYFSVAAPTVAVCRVIPVVVPVIALSNATTPCRLAVNDLSRTARILISLRFWRSP